MTSEGREHGDRRAFLARVRSRQGPPPAAGPHPPPPPPAKVPVIGYRALDGIGADDLDALTRCFVDAATAAGASVDVLDTTEIPRSLIEALVDTHDAARAVVSAEPEARALGSSLTETGLEVSDYEPATAADADLGVTSAVAAVAATGSVVVDAPAAGSRGVSLLPRVHVCVLSRTRLVANHADVLRSPPAPMPSNRVLVTGPSRTADIEQILTTGAHGPVAVHVLLTP